MPATDNEPPSFFRTPAFGTLCTPEHPLGATMVSAEGACAAYYAYGRHLQKPAGAANGETALARVN